MQAGAIAALWASAVLGTACAMQAGGGTPSGTRVTRDAVPCAEDVEAVVAALIRYGTESKELPDFSLVAGTDPIPVSADVSGASCRLSERALPAGSDLRFVLLSSEALQERANEDGRVAYLFVSEARVTGDDASAHIGVGMLLSEDSTEGLLCCCSGDATLVRENGAWRFGSWGMKLCS